MLKNLWMAEDDPDDIEIFNHVVFDLIPHAQLTVFNNGDELLNELQNRLPPDCVILDLNIPGADGFSCLKEIRKTVKLRRLPIIVYTTSLYEADVIKSYGLGANLYIKKPSTYSKIKSTIQKALSLNWNDPDEITSRMFVEGKYIPFQFEQNH